LLQGISQKKEDLHYFSGNLTPALRPVCGTLPDKDFCMPGDKQPQPFISFGSFVADLQTQELKKQGVRLRLPGQSFQILKMLLEQPGELVSREELHQALWPSDTFVDFEKGINAAINRLRETLGDDADNPRYIETLPRRGYRFVGPITQPAPVQVTSLKTRKRKLLGVGLALAGVCALFALGFYWLTSLPPPRVLRYRQLTTDRQVKSTTPCNYDSLSVTDGPRVFFSEPSSSVVQVSSGGGDIAKVSTPFVCFSISDISPDKTELLGLSVTNGMAADQPLWVFSIASGLAHRLGNLTGHAPAWSPDGQRIVYATYKVSGGNDLYIAAKDGSEARKLISIENGYVLPIRWSPDGEVLRMIVRYKSSTSLWEVSTDGSNLHPIAQFPGENRLVTWINWTPDGRYFLLTIGRGNTYSWDIWALRETHSLFRRRTGKPIQLTSGAMSFWSPMPSPDGKQIFAIGGQFRGELARYDLKSRKFEPFLSGMSAEQLDFSKDGNWVAYVTFPEGILWRSRVDGSEKMQLTSSPLRVAVPRWSPDGTRIAFAGYPPEGPWKIYVVSTEGGKPEVVSESQNHELDPTWSPDGNTLIFGGHVFSAQTRISSLDLRTGRVSTILGSEGLCSPRISPDGRFIVAMEAPAMKLFLFDQQTQKWSELVNGGKPSAGWHQWSSDSKSVYIWDFGNGAALSRVRIGDRKIERVAALEVPEWVTGAAAGWMSVAPDGSPLLLRDLSIQEIYALDVDWP
jgi:Tol biopolymer transport system component/DNA-binding winged helix-turn-helix (wHTH) protein